MHKDSGIREDCLNLDKDFVSRVTHTVLGLTTANNHFSLYRESFEEVLENEVDVERTYRPASSDLQFNAQLLCASLPPDPENLADRATMLGTIQSNWKADGRLKMFAWQGETDTVMYGRLKGPFADTVLGNGPGGFPTRNWTNSEQAVRWILKQASIGAADRDLFTLTVKVFVGKVQKLERPVKKATEASDGTAAGGGDGDENDDEGVAGDARRGKEVDKDEPQRAPAEEAMVVALPGSKLLPGANSHEQQKKAQKQYKKTMLKWAESGTVYIDCLIAAHVLDPHVPHIKALLFRAGVEWDDKERVIGVRKKQASAADGSASKGGDKEQRSRLRDVYEGTRMIVEFIHRGRICIGVCKRFLSMN